MRESLAASLRRLGRERVDLLQLHNRIVEGEERSEGGRSGGAGQGRRGVEPARRAGR